MEGCSPSDLLQCIGAPNVRRLERTVKPLEDGKGRKANKRDTLNKSVVEKREKKATSLSLL